jgi:peptidoglycan/xylan/chitin deacetylase (PgdA/CDA1 family)
VHGTLPSAVETILQSGHEIAHHGYLHEHPNACEPEQEAYWFRRASEVIERMTGQPPRGSRAPSYRFSRVSLDILVREGLLYDASLMGDDIPYVLDNGQGQVIELPTHYAMDDWPHFMASRDLAYLMPPRSPQQAMEVYQAEFDAMWEYGGLWIAVWHPFLSGRLARCVAIARLIEYMHSKGRVWFATLEDIATHVRRVIADGIWTPRIDRLPYYDGPIPELGQAAPTLTGRGDRSQNGPETWGTVTGVVGVSHRHLRCAGVVRAAGHV